VFFCVCAVVCLGRGLATSWSLVQGVLPPVNRSGNRNSGQGPQGQYHAWNVGLLLIWKTFFSCDGARLTPLITGLQPGQFTNPRYYCGIFAQSKNCGAKEITFTSERLWNNISFWATAPKQTTKQCLLLGSIFIIRKTRLPLVGTDSVKHVPAATDTHATEDRWFIHGQYWDVISKGQG
jgi:hypothetical protein